RRQFGYPEEDVAGTSGGARLRTNAKQLFRKIRAARTSCLIGRQSRGYPGTDIRARDARITKRTRRPRPETRAPGYDRRRRTVYSRRRYPGFDSARIREGDSRGPHQAGYYRRGPRTDPYAGRTTKSDALRH